MTQDDEPQLAPAGSKFWFRLLERTPPLNIKLIVWQPRTRHYSICKFKKVVDIEGKEFECWINEFGVAKECKPSDAWAMFVQY